MENENNQNLEENSLEAPSEQPEITNAPLASPASSQLTDKNSQKPPKTSRFGKGKLLKRLNVYYVLLVVLLLILGGVTYYIISKNKSVDSNNSLNTQELTVEELKELGNSDAKVGDPKQTLSVESNAIFAGKVLIRSTLDVAGGLKIGGPLSLSGLTAGGTSTLETLQATSLAVSGDAAVQGKLNVQNNLTVNGSGTFSGTLSAPQMTIDTLQLGKDLVLNRHIDAGGATPGRTNGSALGGGGTSSVNGSDTAGTVAINTGSSAPAGCFVTINFAVAFSAAPHVVISPASSQAATLDYYVNRTTSGFSICTASDPPDGTGGIVFDYVVIG